MGPGQLDFGAAGRRGAIDGDWLATEHEGRVDATPENVEAARDFVMARWRERAAELGHPEPFDLTGGCKFAALFVKAAFGGAIQGNHDHVHNVVDGRVVDLSAGSADVAALDDPYEVDECFLDGEDFAYSLSTCLRRVEAWTDAFAAQVTAPRP